MLMRFSQTFFSELGLTAWQARPGYFSPRSRASQPLESHIDSESANTQPSASHSGLENATPMTHETSAVISDDVGLKPIPWVWVGAGLADIWQNSNRPEWQLTINILKAFGRAPDQLHFVDSTLCQSEETMMDTLDKIIELGVERVFVFERDAAIIKDLQAGAELIDLPRFDQLLASAEAKRSLYQILCQATG